MFCALVCEHDSHCLFDALMPLTKKGREIKSAMDKEYGAKKGEQVFYASRNAGKITGVDKSRKGSKKK